MATTWELVGVAFMDAAKAEELVRDLAFRRELRVDPEQALSAFVLWRRRLPAGPTRAAAYRPAARLRGWRSRGSSSSSSSHSRAL